MPISQIVGTESPALQLIDPRSVPKPPGEPTRFTDYLARQTDFTDRGPDQAIRDREKQTPRYSEDPSYASQTSGGASAGRTRVSGDSGNTAENPEGGKQSKIDEMGHTVRKASSSAEDRGMRSAGVDGRKAGHPVAGARARTPSAASAAGERKARVGFLRPGETMSVEPADGTDVPSPTKVKSPVQDAPAAGATAGQPVGQTAENLAEHVADIDVILGRADHGEDGDAVHILPRRNPDAVKRKAKGSAQRVPEAPLLRSAGETARRMVTEKRKVPLHVRDVRHQKAGKARRARPENQSAGPTGTRERPDGAGADRTPGEPGRPAADASTSVTGRSADNGVFVSRADGPAVSARSATATMHTLRQALSDNVNGEIVRAARLVVRGEDTGEIRLHLKPESLGNVRISLRMHEGHIAGRIIVENSSVREVFEQNLADLVRAFNESGLETGAMDIALADPGDGSQMNGRGESKSRVVDAARRLDHAVPRIDVLEDDHELVDLVV